MTKRKLEPLAYGVQEAAFVLGLSRVLVERLMAEGRITYVRAGNRILISRESIDSFLAGEEVRKIGIS